MNELIDIKTICFEIGEDCNLKYEHKKCPINIRQYNKTYGKLTSDRIVKLIDEANEMGFNGHIAFHYYNEPLLYKKRIEEIIEARPDNKYLLWTNGLLLNQEIEKNTILNKFDKVVITCYHMDRVVFFKKIQEFYKNVQIAIWDLDDRLNVYERPEDNLLPCERVLREIPIDYYGNVHLCCEDWDNSFKIGNVLNKSLKDIVKGDEFRYTRNLTIEGKMCENCPTICKKCYGLAIKEYFEIENIKGCI